MPALDLLIAAFAEISLIAAFAEISLMAAFAEINDLTLLHCDKDFDTVVEASGQRIDWVAFRGPATAPPPATRFQAVRRNRWGAHPTAGSCDLQSTLGSAVRRFGAAAPIWRGCRSGGRVLSGV